MQTVQILWADDEIEYLRPHIIFLEERGYKVNAVTSGAEAIERCKNENFDIIFLDEQMPGIGGLDVLAQIKNIKPDIPVVMITKSEAEAIMEDAIGGKISDYLIKPVNPNQILLSCKKLLEKERLVSEKTTMAYQQDFRNISMAFGYDLNHEEWADLYKKLIFWEMELEQGTDKNMFEVLHNQRTEANSNFVKFIQQNYLKWVNGLSKTVPMLSPEVLPKKVFPHLKKYDSVFFVLIDCLRYDQWKVLQPLFAEFSDLDEENYYYAILPTATSHARNAIFSGMYPYDIAIKYPRYWKEDDDEGGKNLYEEEFLKDLLAKYRINVKHSYTKITTTDGGKALAENMPNLMKNDFNVIVYNFVDILAHSKTESVLTKELIADESAYRSITKSWFEHSPLYEALEQLKGKNVKIVLTTDHGTIRVKKPTKVMGERNITSNLRYKQGRNLQYEDKNVFVVKTPTDARLPKLNVSSVYVFAKEDYFFVYPNNFNQYVHLYQDSFQHGGISLEEMIVPLITFSAKR